MSPSADSFTIQIPRRLIEHPGALHIHRMRAAVWLYLHVLSRMSIGADSIQLSIAEAAAGMGLPAGTIRSWLGHLRKHRYVAVRQVGESLLVTVRNSRPPVSSTHEQSSPKPPRFFTIAKLEAALGETGHRDGLESALDAHDDAIVKRALAGALAVPTSEIRRSRTALFLYLLKKHAHEEPSHDPRS